MCMYIHAHCAGGRACSCGSGHTRMMGQDGTDRHREEGRGEMAVQHHMTGEFGGQWLGGGH